MATCTFNFSFSVFNLLISSLVFLYNSLYYFIFSFSLFVQSVSFIVYFFAFSYSSLIFDLKVFDSSSYFLVWRDSFDRYSFSFCLMVSYKSLILDFRTEFYSYLLPNPLFKESNYYDSERLAAFNEDISLSLAAIYLLALASLVFKSLIIESAFLLLYLFLLKASSKLLCNT